jgi:transglutaminase-like putative cysteine protease
VGTAGLDTAKRGPTLAEGVIDGKAAREVLGGLGGGDRQRMAMVSSMAALVDRVEASGSHSGGVLGFETVFHIAARPAAADPAIVDEWLRSTRLRNSLSLPRALTPAELARPVTLGVRVKNPRDLARAFPATARISVTRDQRGDRIRVLPAGWQPSPRVPAPPPVPVASIAPPVQAAAREVVGSLTARADQVAAIISWVHREMTYEITPAWLDDITLLSRKRGDCTEYSQLTVSMLRALGIPARMRSGFLAAGQSLVAHAWIDYFDGTSWQEADPTNGRTTVDASYVDASVLEVLSLLSLGQIEITSME